MLHSDGYCIAKGDEPDAAWDLVEFALGPEGQQLLARCGRSVPSLRAVAESRPSSTPDPPASSQVFLDALERCTACRPRRPGPSSRTRRRPLAELYYGRLELDEALERIEQETDRQF